MLKDALLEMLERERIEKISVRTLCENANVNRSTFYKYYSYILDNNTSSLLDYFDKENTIFILSNLSAI